MANNGSKKTAIVRIERFNPDIDQQPYLQDFPIEYSRDLTILEALHEIKTHHDGSLTYRRSCRHGICGSCGMNVNGTNILVCKSPIKDYLSQDGVIVIKPLAYLPVIKDLVVDRDSFWEQYLRIKPWMTPPASPPEKERRMKPEDVLALKDAEKCIMCGICYSACPVISQTKEFVGPHAMLKAFLRVTDTRNPVVKIHLGDTETVWDCTTCYMCNLQCPKDLDPGSTSPVLRSIFVEDGKVPRMLGNALTSTFRNNNPFEMPHADRTAWLTDLPLKNALEEPVEAMYFMCCIGCYDPRAQKIGQAMVKALDSSGITLGTLGKEEMCCGSEVKRIGELGLFEMILEERTELLDSAQAEKIVTASPHCYDAYKNHYPDLEKPVEHFTQYVAGLIKEGKITFKGSVNKTVTYHDPCYLGLQNKIFDEPRSILESIPGLNLVEMPRSRETSLCCGGGGGKMWFEGHAKGGHLSHERIKEALSTGAEVIATACPFCLNMFDDAIKTLGLGDKIAVMDIMEIVNQAL